MAETQSNEQRMLSSGSMAKLTISVNSFIKSGEWVIVPGSIGGTSYEDIPYGNTRSGKHGQVYTCVCWAVVERTGKE